MENILLIVIALIVAVPLGYAVLYAMFTPSILWDAWKEGRREEHEKHCLGCRVRHTENMKRVWQYRVEEENRELAQTNDSQLALDHKNARPHI